jgi:hypothetical protein
MRWELRPEPPDPGSRVALLRAAELALADEEPESAWWRSGFEELGGGPAPKESWRDSSVVEP